MHDLRAHTHTLTHTLTPTMQTLTHILSNTHTHSHTIHTLHTLTHPPQNSHAHIHTHSHTPHKLSYHTYDPLAHSTHSHTTLTHTQPCSFGQRFLVITLLFFFADETLGGVRIIKTPALSSVLEMLLHVICVLLLYHHLLCPSHSSIRQAGCLKILRSPREQRPEAHVPLCWEADSPSWKGTSETAPHQWATSQGC